MNEFTVHYPLYYIIVFQMFSRYEMNKLSSMQQEIAAKDINPSRQMTVLKHTASIRLEFEKLFSIIPFIVFGSLFAMMPSGIHNMRSPTDAIATVNFIHYVIYGSLIMMVVCHLVFRVCKSQQNVKDIISEMIEMIQRSSITETNAKGHQELIDSLKTYQDFWFTGWQLFRIDHQLILSFFSSIVTFSVLLMQLDATSV